MATVLIQDGCLQRGQVLVAGEVWAKIRTLLNDSRAQVKKAGPSTPVLTAGWRELPLIGEQCVQVLLPNLVTTLPLPILLTSQGGQ